MGHADEQHRNFVFSFGLEKLGLVALKAPAVVAVLIVVATVLGLVGLSKLQVDDSLSELFRTNTEEFRRYEAIDKRFPSSEYDVLVVVEGHDLLKRKQLEAFAGLTTDLQLVDGVSGLVSMLSARGKPDASGLRCAARARRDARGRSRLRRDDRHAQVERHRQRQVPVRRRPAGDDHHRARPQGRGRRRPPRSSSATSTRRSTSSSRTRA